MPLTMRRVFVSERTRMQAQVFCSAEASVLQSQWPVTDNEMRATLGVDLEAQDLANQAWEHVMWRLSWVVFPSETWVWGEAESLIRSGWEPRRWRSR